MQQEGRYGVEVKEPLPGTLRQTGTQRPRILLEPVIVHLLRVATNHKRAPIRIAQQPDKEQLHRRDTGRTREGSYECAMHGQNGYGFD